MFFGIFAFQTYKVTQYFSNMRYQIRLSYNGEKLSPTAIIVNSTQTDCLWGQSRRYPERNNPMTKGTRTEQCFDVVTFCPDGNVRMTRIGAGNDRKVWYN